MAHRFVSAITVVAAIVASRPLATAHVAPSKDDNNRYLKLTPSGDRVRIAYTVLFGEVPGNAQRRSIDTNRDGSITDAEAAAFAQKLGAEVRAGLEITVDGTRQQVAWSEVVASMNSPSINGGYFAIDLVAYACFATARGRHELRVFDRFRISHPGETELQVEQPLGIRVEQSRIGSIADPAHAYKFVGAGGPLADEGLALVIDANAKAATGGAGCAAVAAPSRGLPTGFVIGAAAVLGFAGALGVVLYQRRRKTR